MEVEFAIEELNNKGRAIIKVNKKDITKNEVEIHQIINEKGGVLFDRNEIGSRENFLFYLFFSIGVLGVLSFFLSKNKDNRRYIEGYY